MTCEIWRDQIEMYVDGELALSHESEVARHLRTCADCTAFTATAIHMKRGVESASKRYEPAPEFRESITRSIRKQQASSFAHVWHFALAAALLVVVGAGALLLYNRGRGSDHELADLHLSTIASANPVDVISSDQHTVKPWFQGKLPFSFNLPELSGSPFTLVGGRLVYVHRSPTALLLFQYRLHKISVLIGSTETLSDGRRSVDVDGIHQVRWSEGDTAYVMIGDASPATLKELAQKIRSAQ